MKGQIIKVMPDKLFGFIRGEDHQDYFFHKTDMLASYEDCVSSVMNGQTLNVEFEPVHTPKGLRARVIVMSQDQSQS